MLANHSRKKTRWRRRHRNYSIAGPEYRQGSFSTISRGLIINACSLGRGLLNRALTSRTISP